MTTVHLVAWIVIGIALVATALVVVLHRNPVICALALAANLLAIAAAYLLLSAQFIALLQVIVYAGAIMVLILFVIMLLNLREELRGRHEAGPVQRWVAPVLAGLLALALWRGFGGVPTDLPPVSPSFGTVAFVGRDLFRTFFYPFEAISLLLVAAMIGAVLLAKRRL